MSGIHFKGSASQFFSCWLDDSFRRMCPLCATSISGFSSNSPETFWLFKKTNGWHCIVAAYLKQFHTHFEVNAAFLGLLLQYCHLYMDKEGIVTQNSLGSPHFNNDIGNSLCCQCCHHSSTFQQPLILALMPLLIIHISSYSTSHPQSASFFILSQLLVVTTQDVLMCCNLKKKQKKTISSLRHSIRDNRWSANYLSLKTKVCSVNS